MTANAFFPEGWSHKGTRFNVELNGVRFFVERGPKDCPHEMVVWCGGLGEICLNSAQAVQHIRMLAREVGT